MEVDTYVSGFGSHWRAGPAQEQGTSLLIEVHLDGDGDADGRQDNHRRDHSCQDDGRRVVVCVGNKSLIIDKNLAR